MSNVLISIGPAGAGKTTSLAEFRREYAPKAVYISPDDIRRMMYGDALCQNGNSEVWRTVYRTVRNAIGFSRNVIIDATNANPSDRQSLVVACRNYGATWIAGAWFRTSLDQCLRQNGQRDRKVPEYAIVRMYQSLAEFPPQYGEGFDQLEEIYP